MSIREKLARSFFYSYLLVRNFIVVAEVAWAGLVRAVEAVVTRIANAKAELALSVMRAIVVAVVDVVSPEVV